MPIGLPAERDFRVHPRASLQREVDAEGTGEGAPIAPPPAAGRAGPGPPATSEVVNDVLFEDMPGAVFADSVRAALGNAPIVELGGKFWRGKTAFIG